MLSQSDLNKIFKKFASHNPQPKTELVFANGFQLLIAVLLSAQAQDKTVNKATLKLFKTLKKPSDIYKFSEQTLIEHIKSIGLFRNKAKNIIKTSQILAKEYDDKLPKTRKELANLPGIGQKSSAVLANALFNEPCIAVDTHVFRVANRLGIVSTKNINKTEEKLNLKIPNWAKLNAHSWLVLHGRYVCTAQKPKCDKCLVIKYCQYYLKQLQK